MGAIPPPPPLRRVALVGIGPAIGGKVRLFDLGAKAEIKRDVVGFLVDWSAAKFPSAMIETFEQPFRIEPDLLARVARMVARVASLWHLHRLCSWCYGLGTSRLAKRQELVTPEIVLWARRPIADYVGRPEIPPMVAQALLEAARGDHVQED